MDTTASTETAPAPARRRRLRIVCATVILGGLTVAAATGPALVAGIRYGV